MFVGNLRAEICSGFMEIEENLYLVLCNLDAHMKYIVSFLYLVGGLTLQGFSQNSDWVPTPEYFSVTYDQFPDAEAVKILDKGGISATRQGLSMSYTGIIRVLKESGKDQGEVRLVFNKTNGSIVIEGGSSFNLTDDTQVVRSDLSLRDVVREDLGNDLIAVKFTLPDVRVGSILRISYTRIQSSPFTYLWRFQDDLPVVKSQLRFVSDPEMGYSYLFMGSMLDKFQFDGRKEYKMENLPAAVDEPFVPNEGNFQPRVRIQLTEYLDRSTGRVVQVFPDWKDFGDDQLSRSEIKISKKELKFLAEIAAGMCELSDSEEVKARKIYRYVQDRYRWNEYAGWVPDQSLKELVESKTGDAGEINRLLYGLLTSVGIEARMALVGTRAYSVVIEKYPVASQFNVMMVQCKIGDKRYALDATDPFRPFDLPSREELNGKYLVLDQKNTHWETIPIHQSSVQSTNGLLHITPEGGLTGNLVLKHTGYQAVRAREILNEEGIERFWEWRLDEEFNPGYISSYQILGSTDPDSSLTLKLEIDAPEAAMSSGEFIYLQPILIDRVVENPFKEEERMYPVDFSFPIEREFRVVYVLPEGYEIEEGPQSSQLILPNKEMTFLYQAGQIEASYNVLSHFVLTETYYQQEAVSALRQMYDEMIKRHGQQLVLKKITE